MILQSLPEQLEYWPAIIATDVAVSSKDQETTLGAVLIGNSRRYLQSYKEVKCAQFRADEESDMETTITNTTLNITPEETLETSPLLKKKPQEGSIWTRFSRRIFKTPSSLITTSDDPFGLNEVLDEKEFTWWTKFYNSGIVASSNSISRFKHKLSIYQNELEKQPEFSHLHDWAEPLQLVHGVRYKRNSLPKEEVYATLKMNIKITVCQCGRSETVDASMLRPLATALNPRYQAELHALADLVKLVVRVYVVQGLQLRPREKHAQADSYVRIQLGQKHVTNRAEYVANESSPVFGKCFQIDGLLPR